MVDHPADIVSPTSDHVLPLKTSTVDAAAAGRVPYDKPTPQNSVMLLIDHQIGLMVGVRDFTSLAKMAKALGIPTLLSSSNAQWQNGDTLPELRELFADQPIYRRTGITNCYEDPTFRHAFESLLADTGRTHVILSGVTIDTCCSMPTLAMLNDGYRVFPGIDAFGAWNSCEAEAAMARMSRAGAALVTVFALGCELQADWKLPSGEAMFGPFTNELPEYGFVIQNFWNNANQHVVSDPFGTVK